MIRSLTRQKAPNRLRMLLAVLAVAASAVVLAACSSSGTSSTGGSGSTSTSTPAAATAGSLKTTTIGGATVLTSSKGFTLYSFAPDTATTSKCNGTCAQNWPPVTGPVTASGVKGTFGTIKRSDGSVQATFDGHPLYAFVGDTAPGQAKGNGLNAAGGLWHEVTTSGIAPAAIHLDLYLTGYRTIPTIGWLFLLQVIAAFGLGLAVLAIPRRLAAGVPARLAAAAGAVFALATLGGYLLSVWTGLFGFKEVRTGAGIAAGIIEVAAFVVLAALALAPAPAEVPADGAAAARATFPAQIP